MSPIHANPARPESGAPSTWTNPGPVLARVEGSPLDDWERLRHFVLHGAEDPDSDAGSVEPRLADVPALGRCLALDGPRVIRLLLEVEREASASDRGPALLVLAVASALGDHRTRRAAHRALGRLAPRSEDLLAFADAARRMRGWGRGLKRAVQTWYQEQSPRALARELLEGPRARRRAHAALIRRARPRPASAEQEALFGWILRAGRRGPGGR